MIFGQVNEAMFDWPWSGTHVLLGLAFGMVLILCFSRFITRPAWYWAIGVALLWGWEGIEGLLRFCDHRPLVGPFFHSFVNAQFFLHESWLNICGDIIAGSLGLKLTHILMQAIARILARLRLVPLFDDRV